MVSGSIKVEDEGETLYYWDTKDGRRIDVQEMSDDHLQKTIRNLISDRHVFKALMAMKMIQELSDRKSGEFLNAIEEEFWQDEFWSSMGDD